MIKYYLKYRKSLFYLYLGAIVLFPMIHSLYRLPMISVYYSILLFTFIFADAILIDFIKYRQKWKQMIDINQHLSSVEHPLPETKDQVELEYQKMISSLYAMVQNQVEAVDKMHTEQVEYYTMWVHQIKTPISAMRLSLSSSSSTVHADLLDQELFKIEQYVELALQYTKMKDLSTDLIIREYYLEEIVYQSIKKYAPLFIYKKLSLQIEEFHGIVTTDSKWFAFILEQLLSNAIKYTNQGEIDVSYENRLLKIRDTGIGIREEDIARIFDKGYTGYNGRLDKKASGIGLYLVKKVADSLALKVEIASEVGKGTTVTIIFPEGNSFSHQDMWK